MPPVVQAASIPQVSGPPTFESFIEEHIFGNLTSVAFSLVGIALIAMFIYGGFMYMISGNNPQNKARAQSILFWAVVGAIVVLGSTFIVLFVGNLLGIANPLNIVDIPS